MSFVTLFGVFILFILYVHDFLNTVITDLVSRCASSFASVLS